MAASSPGNSVSLGSELFAGTEIPALELPRAVFLYIPARMLILPPHPAFCPDVVVIHRGFVVLSGAVLNFDFDIHAGGQI
jgi:hypothetical protein